MHNLVPRSLTLKLVLAFLIVSLTGVVLAMLYARQATVREFDRLLLQRLQSDFVTDLTTYYQTTGSWGGVNLYMSEHGWHVQPAPFEEQRPLPPEDAQFGGQPVAQPAEQAGEQLDPEQWKMFQFMLVDQNGIVVLPNRMHNVGEHLTSLAGLEEGVQIEVDGAVVGTVFATGIRPGRDPIEEKYLVRTQQALSYAALGSAAIALLLGVFLARSLTHPLRELTAAISAMAAGNLEQRVAVRSRDELGDLAAAFNQMSADLAHSNDLRRQMTADIAHDLRSPLTVIAGYLEALRDGVLKPTPDRFEAMHTESQHLLRLVEDLRTLSLADAGELTLNRQAVSPLSLLERLGVAYQHQAAQRGVALKVEVVEELPDLHVDAERMVQVLGNLISNALRYTPAGGEIVLGAASEDSTTCLTVRDTGAGIAPDAVPRIFDRFYRVDPAREENTGESGLGLAIAKSIVEAHGGTIRAESTLGQGTTFIIAFSK